MKAKKLFWAVVAIFAAFSMTAVLSSCEKEKVANDLYDDGAFIEEQPLLSNPGAGKTTLCVYIPNSACAEAIPYAIGNLPGGGWTNKDSLKMKRCEDREYWWEVTLPALNEGNADNFKFRMDDGKNEWTYEPKATYEVIPTDYLKVKEDENKNLVAIADCDNQVLYIQCGKWATPCVETNKAGNAKIIATLPEVPEGYVVGVVGKFEEPSETATKYWNLQTGVMPITKGADGKYTLELEVPDACEFKFLLSADGTTWSWELGQASDDNYSMDLDLVSEVEVKAWKGLEEK
jgi:hypothetical protein